MATGCARSRHHADLGDQTAQDLRLGGTLGSRIIGMLFEHVGGAKAFYFMIIPISLLIIALWLLNKFIKDYENAHQQA